ncbi:RNA polymerase factor sigma-54 [Candidatus Omnitrophota bacterium]
MEIRQKIEQRKLLIPELRKSLGILTLPSLDIRSVLEEELINNPLLDEVLPDKATETLPTPSSLSKGLKTQDLSLRQSLLTKKTSLRDILTRQLGMFANSDEYLVIGQEIIENIDGNGYLKAPLEDISRSLNATAEKVEKVLKLIQKFEPPGVGARSVPECLLIQLDFVKDSDPLLRKLIEFHLPDIAKKNYGKITRALKEPLERIEPLIKKILKLDPKPGRNYSTEEAHHIIPDATIDQKDDDLHVIINDENIPVMRINKTYEDMLEKDKLDSNTREFLKEKLLSALELLRAISKRRSTLIKVIRVVVEIQQDAVKDGPSHLKPLTFGEVAQRLKMHETTVCRAVMNKYIRLPWGIVALKDLFPSHISDKNGQAVSSSHTKHLIKELIEQEDKKKPLSDQDIAKHLASEKNLNVSRRTVAKYREELKILSSSYRRER